MDQRTKNYLARRIGILEVNLICEILIQEIAKDIPLGDNCPFSNVILYNSVAQKIKSHYQPRIMDYYNSRKVYL